MYDRAAGLAVRILKGADPAQLPLEDAEPVCAGDQSRDRQGDRPDDPAVAARPRRRRDRMTGAAVSCSPDDDAAFERDRGRRRSPRRRRLRLGLAVKLALAFVGLVSLVLVVNGSARHVARLPSKPKTSPVQIQQEKAQRRRPSDRGVCCPRSSGRSAGRPRRNGMRCRSSSAATISSACCARCRRSPRSTEIDGAGKEQLKLSRTAPDVVASGADDSAAPALCRGGGKRRVVQPGLFPQSVRTLYDDRGRACRASRRRDRCRGQSEVHLGPDQRDAGRAHRLCLCRRSGAAG